MALKSLSGILERKTLGAFRLPRIFMPEIMFALCTMNLNVSIPEIPFRIIIQILKNMMSKNSTPLGLKVRLQMASKQLLTSFNFLNTKNI